MVMSEMGMSFNSFETSHKWLHVNDDKSQRQTSVANIVNVNAMH